MILAVDFDGTLCTDQYPLIGEPITDVILSVKAWRKAGNEAVLWTCREGILLDNALKWCKTQGLEFDAVNANTQHALYKWRSNPRKIGADFYLDDKAISPTGILNLLSQNNIQKEDSQKSPQKMSRQKMTRMSGR